MTNTTHTGSPMNLTTATKILGADHVAYALGAGETFIRNAHAGAWAANLLEEAAAYLALLDTITHS